jgi:mannose-6-phosphate isomerase class I
MDYQMKKDELKNNDAFVSPLPGGMRKFPRGPYEIFPSFTPSNGTISSGYAELSNRIVKRIPVGLRVLMIDGYHGVNWSVFRENLNEKLQNRGINAAWYNMENCLADPVEIRKRSNDFLGGADPLFGVHFPLGLEIFFDAKKISDFRIQASIFRGDKTGKLTIFYGCGAGLLELWDELWYIDIPKDTIQFESRKSKLTNLGEDQIPPFADFYKRSYFLDWPALNRQKRRLLPEIDLLIDLRESSRPREIDGNDFRKTLQELSETPFRVRPWFLPGPWGGKFTQDHMGQNPDEPNMAWSYELITPENGILLKKDGNQLEFSFDFLMFQENVRILGRHAARQFKFEWPIRLDYLDTIDGGNLSTQCHPRPHYMRKHFGETFTQDETYYISNAKPGARVYIGLKESCEPDEFKKVLEESINKGIPVDIDNYMNSEPAKPHDLFLIPNGTVHFSGKGNLVLEISAMPYIFTFKIYDYLRKDLEGNLRPLNIDRGFENIFFDRKEEWVKKNLIAIPELLREGKRWKEFALYNKPFTFYNIHRAEFEKEYTFHTQDKGFAVNLVEGEAVEVINENGRTTPLRYLESMIIPAAAGEVRVVNKGDRHCKLILVYVRPEIGISQPLNDPSN